MTARLPLAVLLLALSLAAGDADTGPRSPAGRAAVQKFEAAKSKADAAYKLAITEALKTEVADLETARQAAMKSDALEEALRLKNAKAAAMEKLAGMTPATITGDGAHFQIEAKQDWQDALEVRKGDQIKIMATGRWSVGVDEKGRHWHGPDGEINFGKRAGFLEARIADGPAIPVGASAKITSQVDGELQLRQHDEGSRDDNDGSITVTITVSKQ